MTRAGKLQLVVRRWIPAAPERLFSAWTEPRQLLAWWGPPGVRCVEANVDLRPGGRYRFKAERPDAPPIVIVGEFLTISRPRELVYTWSIDEQAGPTEQVTVRFTPEGAGSDVVVTHERIAEDDVLRDHRDGWIGCLAELDAHVRGDH